MLQVAKVHFGGRARDLIGRVGRSSLRTMIAQSSIIPSNHGDSSDYICGFEDSLQVRVMVVTTSCILIFTYVFVVAAQARGELDGDSMCRGCLEEITAAYRTARRLDVVWQSAAGSSHLLHLCLIFVCSGPCCRSMIC